MSSRQLGCSRNSTKCTYVQVLLETIPYAAHQKSPLKWELLVKRETGQCLGWLLSVAMEFLLTLPFLFHLNQKAFLPHYGWLSSLYCGRFSWNICIKYCVDEIIHSQHSMHNAMTDCIWNIKSWMSQSNREGLSQPDTLPKSHSIVICYGNIVRCITFQIDFLRKRSFSGTCKAFLASAGNL